MQDQAPKFYETEEFLKLNSTWQDKLKQEGFKDIESGNMLGSVETLGVNTETSKFKSKEQTQEYFSMVEDYLHRGSFRTKKEKKVWTLHSEGFTIGEIAKSLGCSRGSVQYQIHKILKRVRGYKNGK